MGKLLLTESKDRKPCLRFNLKQMREEEKLTQIMLVTTVNKQRIRIYTKLRIEPKYWDKYSYRCKADQSMPMRKRSRLNQINSQLNRLELAIEQADAQLAEHGKYLTHTCIQTIVEERRVNNNVNLNPISYFHLLVEEYLKNLNRRGKRGISSTQKTYYTALKRLETFCLKQKYTIRSFENFDKKFFTDFTQYLYTCTYRKGKEQKLYTQNTVINTIKVIKNLLHRAYDNEITDNNYFQKVQTILPSDTCEKIYLQEKEIKKLANMKLTLPCEKNIRDMFVISCYTALRISDIQKMNDAVIKGGFISLYQTKTKEHTEIPILKEIAPLVDYYKSCGFPSIDVCKANETIKDLARRCGICENINYKEHRGGITITKTSHKWELITFHTARRSCITNLYKRGYPINYIMSLSGHRSIQAFQRYMRASSKELMTNFVNLLKKDKAL